MTQYEAIRRLRPIGVEFAHSGVRAQVVVLELNDPNSQKTALPWTEPTEGLHILRCIVARGYMGEAAVSLVALWNQEGGRDSVAKFSQIQTELQGLKGHRP